ncbi:MAG: phosphoribosylglycinamide formyltransferase [Planctomycetota bacterium]
MRDPTPSSMPGARLMVMLSGAGRTLRNLLDSIDNELLAAQIVAVVANRDCGGIELAREHAIPAEVIPGGPDADTIDGMVLRHRVDWIILAGYLRLIPITDRISGRVINIHPSLLPAFGGPGMHGMRVHTAAIEAAKRGDITESGCTVHYADARYDTGRIILQRRCPVLPEDTPEQLADRVFDLEREAYPEALRMIISET